MCIRDRRCTPRSASVRCAGAHLRPPRRRERSTRSTQAHRARGRLCRFQLRQDRAVNCNPKQNHEAPRISGGNAGRFFGFTGGGRGVKRHLQRRFLRKRSAAGKVCTGFQRAEPSQLRCAQHGTMRSISARNSRFFVSTCDNSSLSADRLIYLFISVLYHFCGYIAIVRYCLSLQFCLLPFR